MAEVFGIAAGVAGFISLGVQLTESISKLRKIRHTYKDAHADITASIKTLEWLASILKQSGTATQPANVDPLQMQPLEDCKKRCHDIINGIDEILRSILDEIKRNPWIGKSKAVFRKNAIDGRLATLEKAKQDLTLALVDFGR
jgi:hypothetical protein